MSRVRMMNQYLPPYEAVVKAGVGLSLALIHICESKDISITSSKEALSFYDEASSSWKAEAGKIEALVGNAADNLKLKTAFELF